MVHLTTGLKEPVSPSCLISPHQGEGGQDKKSALVVAREHNLHKNCTRGSFRASQFASAVLRKEKERPIHRITTSLKRSQNSSWAEQQQRWVDVEKLIQFDGPAWSRAATVPRTGLAVLDQPQSCRTGRNRMSFPSHFPANLNTRGRAECEPQICLWFIPAKTQLWCSETHPFPSSLKRQLKPGG